MKTFQIDVLEENNEGLVMNLLQALEKNKIVRFSTKKSHVTPGEPMSVNELDNLLDKSLKSKSYSYDDAKKYLNL